MLRRARHAKFQLNSSKYLYPQIQISLLQVRGGEGYFNNQESHTNEDECIYQFSAQLLLVCGHSAHTPKNRYPPLAQVTPW